LTDLSLQSGEALPPFIEPRRLFARASSVLLPRKRMKPSEAAEAYRFITTGGQTTMWRNASAPYMVEPMDCTVSRELEAVVFAGPARSSKTAGLILNTLLHRICCDPCNVLLVHTNHDSARLFSQEQIDAMNRDCRAVRERLSRHRNEDNIFDKKYAGMRLVVAWPTLQHLAGTDYELVLDTEYDRKPDSIGSEGSPFELERKRTQTFGSRGMVVVECSPGRDVIQDPERPWTPRGHEAPPTTGILELFNQGDRRLLYWPCPHCNEFFEGRFAHLGWPKRPDGSPDGEIDDVAAEVGLFCPHCGAEAKPRHKPAMVADARWLKDGETISAEGAIGGSPRRSKIASFWLKGPAASFQSWESIVRNYLRAVEAFQRTGDQQTLRSVTNVDLGEPFTPPAAPGTEALDTELLRTRAEPDWTLGTVPAGVRALVVTVDVQKRYFDVQVTGIGAGFETWIVDRFQIAQSAEEGRLVDPGSYPEDWDLLWPLLQRAWPLAGDPARAMRPLCVLVDSGGEAGVTGNAYGFAAKARKQGIADARLILLKGDAKVGARRVALTRTDWTKDGKVLAKGLHLLLISSNDMKDDVAGGLKREAAGPGYVHTPHDLPADWYSEVGAEHRVDGKWSKRSHAARNEAFDHLCYARAALLRPPYRWDRIIWDSAALPGYAQPHDRNTLVRAREDGDAAGGSPPGFPPQPGPEGPEAPRSIGSGLARLARLNARH
jgi:phage terminase large subunit GpA-like protein